MKKYKCTIAKDGNVCEYFAKTSFAEVELGECKLNLYPADKTREVTDYEIGIIEEQISKQKEIISEEADKVYKLFKPNRKQIQKEIKNQNRN